jgi:hypothetical protein
VSVWIEFAIGAVICLLCGYFGYRLAADKGRRPWLWGILSFLFPFIGLLVIAMLSPADTRTSTQT